MIIAINQKNALQTKKIGIYYGYQGKRLTQLIRKQELSMGSRLQLPDLKEIKINDSLWYEYTKKVADIIIPYQWTRLNGWENESKDESVCCIRNFRIAAGKEQGEHNGIVCIDSDLYKWLETTAYCIANGSGTEFGSIADEAIDLIAEAQQPDGYINTYYTIAEPDARWSNLVEGHELYCAGHMFEAAVAYFEATGKRKILDVSVRFADLICDEFGPEEGQRKGYPGHQEIELALIKLYRCTNNSRYLDCARFFIDERGKEPNYLLNEIEQRGGHAALFPEFNDYDLKYSQAHIPPREQKIAEGHAVRAVYMYSAMADIAQERGDKELLQTCRTLWKNVTEKRMYITGGIGSSGHLERFTTDYDLPNASAYNETCAAVGLAQFSRRMANIEKSTNYYDIIERLLYNNILAGISFTGDRYFYVNPLEMWPDTCIKATSMKHVKPVRQEWFPCACCPPNVARTLASLGHYIYAFNDDTVYINLFISSSYNTALNGGNAQINMKSDLLHSGEISILFNASVDLRLAVRVPDFAGEINFMVDGVEVMPRMDKGYAVFDLNTGDHHIETRFDVSPRWVVANQKVREDVGKVALMKGPCVYCLEEADNGSDLASVFVRINSETQVSDAQLPAGLPAIEYTAERLINQNQDGALYAPAYFTTSSEKVSAVPYCIWGNRKTGEMIVWQKLLPQD